MIFDIVVLVLLIPLSAVVLGIGSGKAKIDRMKAERQLWQQPVTADEPAVLAEMKAMRQQMEQMQSTGHQFDLSFDEALNRLEGRINRLETKSAVTGTVPQTDVPNTLRNGQS